MGMEDIIAALINASQAQQQSGVADYLRGNQVRTFNNPMPLADDGRPLPGVYQYNRPLKPIRTGANPGYIKPLSPM